MTKLSFQNELGFSSGSSPESFLDSGDGDKPSTPPGAGSRTTDASDVPPRDSTLAAKIAKSKDIAIISAVFITRSQTFDKASQAFDELEVLSEDIENVPIPEEALNNAKIERSLARIELISAQSDLLKVLKDSSTNDSPSLAVSLFMSELSDVDEFFLFEDLLTEHFGDKYVSKLLSDTELAKITSKTPEVAEQCSVVCEPEEGFDPYEGLLSREGIPFSVIDSDGDGLSDVTEEKIGYDPDLFDDDFDRFIESKGGPDFFLQTDCIKCQHIVDAINALKVDLRALPATGALEEILLNRSSSLERTLQVIKDTESRLKKLEAEFLTFVDNSTAFKKESHSAQISHLGVQRHDLLEDSEGLREEISRLETKIKAINLSSDREAALISRKMDSLGIELQECEDLCRDEIEKKEEEKEEDDEDTLFDDEEDALGGIPTSFSNDLGITGFNKDFEDLIAVADCPECEDLLVALNDILDELNVYYERKSFKKIREDILKNSLEADYVRAMEDNVALVSQAFEDAKNAPEDVRTLMMEEAQDDFAPAFDDLAEAQKILEKRILERETVFYELGKDMSKQVKDARKALESCNENLCKESDEDDDNDSEDPEEEEDNDALAIRDFTFEKGALTLDAVRAFSSKSDVLKLGTIEISALGIVLAGVTVHIPFPEFQFSMSEPGHDGLVRCDTRFFEAGSATDIDGNSYTRPQYCGWGTEEFLGTLSVDVQSLLKWLDVNGISLGQDINDLPGLDELEEASS
jgi:hypothetical protein